MKNISVFAIFIAIAVSGCASQKYDLMIQEMQSSIKNVQDRTSDINRTQSEGIEKMEVLNAKIILLEGKLNDINKDIDEIKAQEVAKEAKVEQKTEGPKEQPAVEAEERLEEAVQEEEVSSPEALYKEGQELLNAGKQIEAISAFKSLVKHYPKSSLADNAVYWMGEIHFSNMDYPAALVEFRNVVDNYPGGNKTPDALLKLGITHQQIGEKDKAAAALKELIAGYPKSEAAKKAKSKLKE